MQNHLIHRQVLDLHLSSREKAFGMQEQFRKWYYEQFLAVLDEVLTEIAQTRSIRIEKLEIDLGQMISSELLDLPKSVLRDKIFDQLIHYAPELLHIDFSHQTENVKILSQEHDAFESFVFFLLQGRLPWYQADIQPGATDKLLAQVLQEKSQELAVFFQKHFNQTILRRLTKQFQPKQLKNILKRLEPKLTHLASEVFEAWKILETMPVWPSDKINTLKEKDFYRFVFSEIYFSKVSNAEQFLEHFIHKVAQDKSITHQDLLKTIKPVIRTALKANNDALNNFQKLIKQNPYSEPESISDRKAKNAEQAEKAKKLENPDQAVKSIFDKDLVSHTDLEAISDLSEPLNETGLMVKQAGLVLLWPYLRRFFDKLGLLKENNFKDEESREKAVLITHCIVETVEEVEEHLLILPKIMCNWPINKPINRIFNITETEKNEIQDLLSSVISNWAALKNTSVEGFRSAFLKREGILIIEEDKIRVLLERKGIDILLERLPWSIASFKLPWVLKPFFVDW